MQVELIAWRRRCVVRHRVENRPVIVAHKERDEVAFPIVPRSATCGECIVDRPFLRGGVAGVLPSGEGLPQA